MKRIILALWVVAAAHGAHAQSERNTVEVQLVNGKIAVSKVQLTRVAGQPTVWWRISTPGQQFADDGIVFLPSSSHRCQALEKNRLMRCDKTAEATAKSFRYVIRLADTRTLQPSQPPQPDLWIQDE